MTLTLHKRSHPFAAPDDQKELLESLPLGTSFEERLARTGLHPLVPTAIDTLQINVGKLCNQTCKHCHVDAGPDRTELMDDDVLEACLRLLLEGAIPTLDITGGAPELHPRFRDIVHRAGDAGRRILHRCNLTAILLPAYADIPELLAERSVEVIASLPYYLPKQTDAQRGLGVFEKSLQGLRRLNELGYGDEDSGLLLDLVTNPVGAFLPGSQEALETDWKRELQRRYGIRFNRLYTITNMPISRFLEFLVDSDNLEGYMERLVQAYNPTAAAGVMCRNLVSVGYDGVLYDCDFNQMLELPVAVNGSWPVSDAASPPPPNVLDGEPATLLEVLHQRRIRTAPHCFGCTAGAGSSCGGAVV